MNMQGERFLSSLKARIGWLVFCSAFISAFAFSAAAQTAPLVLLSEEPSTRALALESVTFSREPFPVNSLISWSADPRTRVILFALNLQLQPGDDLSAVTADAEDASHQHYALRVEALGPMSGQPWLNGVTLRLSDQLTEVGDVLVRLSYRGRTSNRVRIAIGHISGGPTDDAGARPTSPYFLRGKVTAGGLGLAGVPVTLQGSPGTFGAFTNAAGDYEILAVGGDYVLSVSQPFFDFTPPAKTFNNLSQTLDGVDFVATRQKKEIYGVLLDDNGQVVPNLEMTLTSSNFGTQKATTDNRGIVAFSVPAGFAYTLTPGNHNIFAFTSQSIAQLTDNTTLSFNGVRREYTISGQVKSQNNTVITNAVLRLKETGALGGSNASRSYD